MTKEDKHFISNEDYEFILEVNKIIDEEKCIQLYTNKLNFALSFEKNKLFKILLAMVIWIQTQDF